MRIGIFLVMVGRAAAGPETYENRLVRALVAVDRKTEFHIFCLDAAAVNSLGIDQPNVVFHVLWPRNRWVSMSVSLPLAIQYSGINILHATFAPPPVSPVDYLFTMHGSVTLSHPYFYPPLVVARLNALLRRGLKKSRLTLCVSEFVRQELIEHFGVPEDKLLTVHHGAGEDFRTSPTEGVLKAVLRRYHIDRPYFLYVGKLHTNKNIVRLIEAFHAYLNETKADMLLVLVGRQVWGCEGITETIIRLRLTERVRLIGHQPQSELPALYHGSSAFVFPSLWEGFGLPVVEAMACGTPVIASDIASLPEITAGAALLFDPESTDDLAASMCKVMNDDALRADLRTRGLARSRCFDWEQTAIATLAAYRRVGDQLSG